MLRFLLLILFIHFSVELLAQESDNVPFAIIEQAPIYPGCEDLDKKTQKKCLQDSISSHVSKNYNLNMVQTLDLDPGKVKMYIQFRINKEGIVDSIKARAPHIKLEYEGIRVMKLLPQMKPGFDNDRVVAVKYTLPVTFYIEPKKKKKLFGF
ncbi:MAG: hypothetical protein KDC74_08850 [Flavobacteriaceae bacterium]|nr:hypothetical protein [Flavobacteriaceae bacterium]